MAGRKPAEAVENFLAPIRDAVSCIVPHPALVTNRGYDPKNNPHALVLNEGDPVSLPKSKLSLTLNQTYGVVRAEGDRGPYKVSTISYIYRIDDSAGELVSFHYHPDHHVDFCHMHLRQNFDRVHFPTGRVAIEEVIAMLIRDFGIPPRRKNYEALISEGLEKFRTWRTWHSRGTV